MTNNYIPLSETEMFKKGVDSLDKTRNIGLTYKFFEVKKVKKVGFIRRIFNILLP
jgi:hypothetical protein